MAAGRLTSERLTRDYIQRILDLDQGGPGVNSVIEINPDAISMAATPTRSAGAASSSVPARHPGPPQGQH